MRSQSLGHKTTRRPKAEAHRARWVCGSWWPSGAAWRGAVRSAQGRHSVRVAVLARRGSAVVPVSRFGHGCCPATGTARRLTGSPERILFESRPLFWVISDARDHKATEA